MPATDDKDFLPGMAPRKNQRVHTAALRYVKARDERIALNVTEKEAHQSLLIKMKEEGLEDYIYGDLEVHVDNREKCKVKVNNSSPEGDE